MRTRLIPAALLIAALLALLVGLPALAAAPDTILSFDVSIEVAPDGSLIVTEEIVYDFGRQQRHGIFRDIPTRARADDTFDRVTPVEVLDVKVTGAPDDVEVSGEPGGITRMRIGDPDEVVSGVHTYTIVYRVRGAMNGFDGHDELYWNATGDDWPGAIEEASVSVSAPARIIRAACFQGWERSTEPCEVALVKGRTARFAAGRSLLPGEGLTFVVALPKGAVTEPQPILEERWAMGRAFAVTPASISLSLVALLVCGVLLFGAYWKVGRDRRFRGSQIDHVMGSAGGEDEPVPLGGGDAVAPVEFAPPENLRPGHMGMLLEEQPRTLHVTATIVDLAVRGHLMIRELEGSGFLSRGDWELVAAGQATDEMPRYERLLLDGLFEGRASVRVSELRNTFAARMTEIMTALTADGMRQRWFREKPGSVRGRWSGWGVLLLLAGIGLTYVLARYTHLGLVGLVVVGAGLALIVLAGRMPARTAKGFALVQRIRGFRQVIETADRHMARWAEQENVFTRLLPYAVVFGVTDKWAKAFESLGQMPGDDMSWYVSSRVFVYSQFADSLDSFAVTTSGTISSTPSGSGGSGFGGGGFSGGGGGGGGGGSW